MTKWLVPFVAAQPWQKAMIQSVIFSSFRRAYIDPLDVDKMKERLNVDEVFAKPTANKFPTSRKKKRFSINKAETALPAISPARGRVAQVNPTSALELLKGDFASPPVAPRVNWVKSMAILQMIRHIIHILKWAVYGGAVRDWCGDYLEEIQDIDVEKPKDLDMEAAETRLFTSCNVRGWHYLGLIPKGRHCREFYFSWKIKTAEELSQSSADMICVQISDREAFNKTCPGPDFSVNQLIVRNNGRKLNVSISSMLDDLEVIDIIGEIIRKRFTLLKGLDKRGMTDRCHKMHDRQWAMTLPAKGRYTSTINQIYNEGVNNNQILSRQVAPGEKKFSRTSCNGTHRLLTSDEILTAMANKEQEKKDNLKAAEAKRAQKILVRETKKLESIEKKKKAEQDKLERLAKKKQLTADKEKAKNEKLERKNKLEAEKLMKRKKAEEAKDKATKNKKQKRAVEKSLSSRTGKGRRVLGEITNTISQRLYCYCEKGRDDEDGSLFWVCEGGKQCKNRGFIHKECHQLTQMQIRQKFWCTDCVPQVGAKRSSRKRKIRKVCYHTSL